MTIPSLNEVIRSIEARLVELEIKSEERASDIVALEEFVRGYENRIGALESELRLLKEQVLEGTGDLPSPEDDRPPHY